MTTLMRTEGINPDATIGQVHVHSGHLARAQPSAPSNLRIGGSSSLIPTAIGGQLKASVHHVFSALIVIMRSITGTIWARQKSKKGWRVLQSRRR
jgi:hypothetical protein